MWHGKYSGVLISSGELSWIAKLTQLILTESTRRLWLLSSRLIRMEALYIAYICMCPNPSSQHLWWEKTQNKILNVHALHKVIQSNFCIIVLFSLFTLIVFFTGLGFTKQYSVAMRTTRIYGTNNKVICSCLRGELLTVGTRCYTITMN